MNRSWNRNPAEVRASVPTTATARSSRVRSVLVGLMLAALVLALAALGAGAPGRSATGAGRPVGATTGAAGAEAADRPRFATAAAGPSAAARRNPAVNVVASPAYPRICSTAPRGTACLNTAIAALNHARTVLHQPRYALPASFGSQSSASQLLILINSDRTLYHLPVVTGLNSALTAQATRAAQTDQDPTGPARFDRATAYGWTSNWAAGYASPLYAYYEWMYDDGYGSVNIDCSRPSAAACWGHRQDVLASFGGNLIALGVGIAISPAYHATAVTTLMEGYRGTATFLPQIDNVSRTGRGILLQGSGYLGVQWVTIAGRRARILVRTNVDLIVAPIPGVRSGPVQVATTGGRSAQLVLR